jgi:hypothetical protein
LYQEYVLGVRGGRNRTREEDGVGEGGRNGLGDGAATTIRPLGTKVLFITIVITGHVQRN